ncbi:hypothetical protein H4R20_000215 [Coemansia guatemalensis]|uniref:Uncharacterized protein n=1 Tax=Coemansia guatemalensis TaxID=2761395 RepID=A0A9W8I864_9FUNG|nr:hypothetical protein H4R20_000215 [Coemansia guatemalensis]
MSKLAAGLLTKGGVIPESVKFADKPKTLYELLNVQRTDAKYKAVPRHWFLKGFDECYYEVHRTKYKMYKGQPTHGKAWGILYWNGKPLSQQPKEIRGGLKFSWMPYQSPHAKGIYYDEENARSIERRRSMLLLEYGKEQKQDQIQEKQQ